MGIDRRRCGVRMRQEEDEWGVGVEGEERGRNERERVFLGTMKVMEHGPSHF